MRADSGQRGLWPDKGVTLMAFTYGLLRNELGIPHPVGGEHMVAGWFKSDGGSTGGDIVTGFKHCSLMLLQPHAAAVGNQAVVNEAVADITVSAFTATVTIVSDADEVGRFLAFGA